MRFWRRLVAVIVVGGMGVWILGCGGEETPTAKKSVKTQAPSTPKESESVSGWATIRGRVVFGGEKLPEKVELTVNKDTEHCLSKGPLFSEKWVVNPENRGVRWAVAFLRPERGKKLPIHDSLKTTAKKEVFLDQPVCVYQPHVLAFRAGQKLIAKNPAPVVHNVMLTGLKNSFNVQIPPGQTATFDVVPESLPIKISCSVHQWMEGFAWVFTHPYFAVTDADGKFEIKLAPAGKVRFVLWHEVAGFVPGPKGREIELKPNATLDLGGIVLKP